MRKSKIAIPVVAIAAAAAIGGGAYAATQTSSNPEQALINDAAGRLHVTPSQLRAALKAAMIDRINAAVKAGRLSQAQANALIQRIEHGGGVPFGHPGFFGHGRMHGPRLLLAGAAASYLGLSPDQLRQQLESGKSLAQIASQRGKSVSGLEQAITAQVKSRLDKAVAAGRITKAQEQRRLDRLSQFLPQIVNHAPPPGPPGAPGAHGLQGPAGDDAPPPGPPADSGNVPPAT